MNGIADLQNLQGLLQSASLAKAPEVDHDAVQHVPGSKTEAKDAANDDGKFFKTVVKTPGAAAAAAAADEKENDDSANDNQTHAVDAASEAGAAPPADPKDIWAADEIETAMDADDVADGRDVPDYEILYKQMVSAEDTYLGMSGRDPSSNSCSHIVVRIELPESKGGAELDLDVNAHRLLLRTPTYKLFLPLPYKVDDAKGDAKWDGAQHRLDVTLPTITDDEYF